MQSPVTSTVRSPLHCTVQLPVLSGVPYIAQFSYQYCPVSPTLHSSVTSTVRCPLRCTVQLPVLSVVLYIAQFSYQHCSLFPTLHNSVASTVRCPPTLHSSVTSTVQYGAVGLPEFRQAAITPCRMRRYTAQKHVMCSSTQCAGRSRRFRETCYLHHQLPNIRTYLPEETSSDQRSYHNK